MSTSCCIGLLQDNKVKYITVHSDGYLSFTGLILQCGYTSVEKINALINLGCLSALGYNINAPKKFKDYLELSAYYCCSLPHVRTTFCTSYIRDLQSKSEYNKPQVCSLKEICTGGYGDYVYLYDIRRKCWFVTAGEGDEVLYNLYEVLTDRVKFLEYRNAAGLCISWKDLTERYAECKADILGKGEHNIIGQYNAWIKTEAKGRGLEFGYAVRDGKRVYALLRKSAKESGRRKVVMYSDNIVDLSYAIYKGEAQEAK